MKLFHWLILFICYKIVLYPFLKLIIGCEFNSKQRIKALKQFVIIAGNHSSHADTGAIMANLPAKFLTNVMPVAAKDYFGSTTVKAFLSKLFINVLLIERHHLGAEGNKNIGIQLMINALDEGKSLVIFPEGTRSNSGDIREFKSGIVRVLLERSHIPYLPTYVSSSAKVLPKGDPLVLPHNFSVTIGGERYVDKNISVDENMSCIKSEIEKIRDSLSSAY